MKKRIFFFIFIILIIIVIGANLLTSSRTGNVSLPGPFATPTPVGEVPINVKNIDYSNIFTNPSVQKQVTASFQVPNDFKKQGDMTAISFPTEVDKRNNVVYEQNNVAKYISQEVTTDNASLNDFIALHPTSQSFQMFDTNAGSAGFSWYIFPADGVAFLANKESGGYAIRIIYFTKTTKEDFVKNVAKIFNMLEQDPYATSSPEGFE